MAASSTGDGKASCDLPLYLPLSLNSSYNLHHRCAWAREVVACFIFIFTQLLTNLLLQYILLQTYKFISLVPFFQDSSISECFQDAAASLFFDLNQ